MRRPRPTAESKARAERIARALAGQLEEPPVVKEPGRTVTAAGSGELACPSCAEAMQAVGTARGVEVDQCPGCGAVWLDAGELEAMVAEARAHVEESVKSVAELRSRMATVVPQEPKVRYRECPRCHDVMGRRNFGTISGVVVDECKLHGVLLDEGELQAIEAFVRLGGARLGDEARAEQLVRTMPPPPDEPRPGELRRLKEDVVRETVADTIWNLLFR